ncbi:MAG: DUF192 domain-containing protein [Alphaproteobacteria bacterium]|nr:DUF192 domain-containing protein [Alphaproteobacteria bacterium]
MSIKTISVAILAFALVACKPDNTKNYAFKSAGAKDVKVALRLEVANNHSARMKGLSHRHELPDGTGMLFVFDEPDYYAMWMKDTFIPLDIIFLNNDKVVTYIAADRPINNLATIAPCHADGREPDDACIMKNSDIRYVVEIPAGAAAKHGIIPGDILVGM